MEFLVANIRIPWIRVWLVVVQVVALLVHNNLDIDLSFPLGIEELVSAAVSVGNNWGILLNEELKKKRFNLISHQFSPFLKLFRNACLISCSFVLIST